MKRAWLVGLGSLALGTNAFAIDVFTLHSGQTVLSLDRGLLASNGVTVSVDLNGLDVADDGLARLGQYSQVEGIVMDGPGAFVQGTVLHRNGLIFQTPAGTFHEDLAISLDGSIVASGIELTVGASNFSTFGGSLEMDIEAIRLTPEFATLIGAPQLAGVAIGTGQATSVLSIHNVSDLTGIGSADEADLRGGCTPSTGPDVIVGDMPAIANYSVVGGIDAFSVATTSCNIGSVNLQWIASSVNHPVIPQNLYRLKTVNGAARFEQVGQSWMKHAFTALTGNICCTCNGQGGSVLGIGCSDPYTAGRNGEQSTNVGGLGPRFQVNAHTGAFVWPYMFRDNSTYIPETSITRRLQVATSDLDPALNSGATYWAETHYVTPDDAASQNQDNNASYRQCSMSYSGGNATGTLAGTTVRQKAAITRWKTSDASVTETNISTPESTTGDQTGLAILSAKATEVPSAGSGIWRYEYALYNMNSHRSFSSFSVPVPVGATVTNIEFHDVPYHSGDGFNSAPGNVTNFDGTDWPGIYGGGTVSWTLVPATPVENSNALRWSTLYNFRFDCDASPTSGSATMGLFRAVAGLPTSVAGATVVPDVIEIACPGDTNGDNVVNLSDLSALLANFGTTGGATLAEGDLDGDTDVDLSDLSILLANFGTDCNLP